MSNTSTLDIRVFLPCDGFIFRACGTPIDRVETITEFVRGCEFPFPYYCPDDYGPSYASGNDDDSDDRVAGEMTAAAVVARGTRGFGV